MSSFGISVESNEVGSHVIRVVGELDVAAAPSLRARGRELVDATPGRVVLDLSGITFIDSTGVGAMVDVRNLVLEAGGSLELARISPPVERNLERLGLAGLFGESAGDSQPPKPQEV